VIQALITAAKQLRCLQFTKGEENDRMNVEEGPKGVRSPLQRLIATASSMSEHAAQLYWPSILMLQRLETSSTFSFAKVEGSLVYIPIHVADELLVYQHFKVKEMNDRFV